MNDDKPSILAAEGFGDPETLFNSRDWLRKAIEAKGAKVVGGGIGMGQCDLDFELEGMPFNISLRPIVRQAPLPAPCPHDDIENYRPAVEACRRCGATRGYRGTVSGWTQWEVVPGYYVPSGSKEP